MGVQVIASCMRQNFLINTGAVAVIGSFSTGASQIWLDNVQCVGTETRLIDCPANPLGSHNCDHTEDAGVRCQEICKLVVVQGRRSWGGGGGGGLAGGAQPPQYSDWGGRAPPPQYLTSNITL